MLVLFGLVLIFSGPRLGEVFQCYWGFYEVFGEVPSSVICESPAGVEFKFVAPFEVAGAVLCAIGIWLTKGPREIA